jgi:hypothetical protein
MAGIIALPMAVAATAMGIYNLDQINFQKTELGKLERHQLRFRSHVFSQQTTDLKTDRKFSTSTRLSIENFQANTIPVAIVVCS